MSDSKDEDMKAAEIKEAVEEVEIVDTSSDEGSGELLQQIEALQEETASLKEEALRHRAELENYRKRMQREKDELRKSAASNIIEELLPAMDNMKLGLLSADQHPEAKVVTEGFQMVYTQLSTTLQSYGLKEVNPEEGAFNPNFHDCVSQQSSDTVPEDHIVQVIRPGYTLHERLLRPAHVVVSSGPDEPGKEGDDEPGKEGKDNPQSEESEA